MSKMKSYTSRLTGEETIYLQCAIKQKLCPAKGSVKRGVVAVQSSHNHGVEAEEQEVTCLLNAINSRDVASIRL